LGVGLSLHPEHILWSLNDRPGHLLADIFISLGESTALAALTVEEASQRVENAMEFYDSDWRRRKEYRDSQPLIDSLFDLKRFLFAYRDTVSSVSFPPMLTMILFILIRLLLYY